MKQIIRCSINVNEITKERLYKGKKGLYLSCTLIETPNSEHNDFMIVEDITKEEREAGKESKILGNGKEYKKDSEPAPEDLDDLPF